MRILHVILKLDATGGGPTSGLATLAREQARRGDDVVVIPGRAGIGPQTLETGRDGNLLVCPAPTRSRLLWYDGRLNRLIREKARDRDVVHIHGTWRYHVLSAAAAAQSYGIPYIIRPAGNLGLVPLRHKPFLKWPYFLIFERRIFDQAAAIQCCSRKEMSELPACIDRERCIIVPQPIRSDLRELTPDFDSLNRLCPNLSDGDDVILYLGRISAIKRLEVLIDAFIRLSRDFPGWHLVVAGPLENASLAEELRRRVEQAGLADRFCMPGMVLGASKAAFLARADVFAQPSAHENFGLSVAEALLFGLPCVVSSGVALADDIRAARAGIVCESTVEAFESALRKMLSDEALRSEYGRSATAMASQFSPCAVADQVDALYRKCLAQRTTVARSAVLR